MKFITHTSTIALALMLAACGGQKTNQGTANEGIGPTADQVDAYMESKLPDYLDVKDVKTENFIDPNTKEGRISISATFHFNEATYRDATNAEILDYLQAHGISRNERQLYVPFNQFQSVNMEHRFLSFITGPEIDHAITTELLVKKTVEGWSFEDSGGLANGRGVVGIDQKLMAGKPLREFGAGGLPFGSPQAEAYLSGAVQQKQNTNSGEDTLLANVRTLFVPGRSIVIHMLQPQGKKRDDITFTTEANISVSPDGKSSFVVVGAIQHSDLTQAPYQSEQSPKARITGQLEHRQGSLAPNYVLTLDFLDPRNNQYGGHSMISNAEIFDKRITSTNGMYDWNWWTD